MDYRSRQRNPNLNSSSKPHNYKQAAHLDIHNRRKHEFLIESGASSGTSGSGQSSLVSDRPATETTISTTTHSSQAKMLPHSNKILSSHQQQLLQQQQQHHHKQQQQHQMQRQQHHMAAAAAAGNHRQTNLSSQQHNNNLVGQSIKHQQQQQSLGANTAPTTINHNNYSKATNNHHSSQQQQVDNMTTSSSDHTIDDLQQLAHGYRLGHRSRYTSAVDDLSSGSSMNHSSSGGRFLLGVLFTLAELLLFTVVLLWLYWAYQHDDGLAWQSDRKQQFNTHAALMLIGFIFLNGQAILIYRSFQCCNKIYTKILHTILFVFAVSAISLALILAYTAQENVGQNSKPIMHFYSLHAWMGLATVGLFILQFVFGFVSFLILLCCDRATSKYRAALLPIHKTFGLIIFSLAIATCLTGLLQTARSRLSSKLNKTDYHELGEAGIVINLIGVCLICLAILMPYIIRNLDTNGPRAGSGAMGHNPIHSSKRPFRSELDRRLMLSQLEMRI